MAGGHSKRGDRVLESRHLIGLFLGVVLLCCVFFTLGYVMGKTQYGNSPVQAASLDNEPPRPAPRVSQAPRQPQSSPEWDFYAKKETADVPLKPARVGEQAPAQSQPMESASARSSSSSAPSALVRYRPVPSVRRPASATPARFRAPRMSKNAVVLQVGALKSESDALAMADALQQKGFPAFVINPTTDGFYRVQVGPFDNQAVGDKAKQSLQREGFKAIYRR